MDPTVIAAIITTLGAITGAFITAWGQRRTSGSSGDVSRRQPSSAVPWLLVGGMVGGVLAFFVGSMVVVSTGPETARGPKPAPGYELVEDPTGSLTVEVPPSWEDVIGEASEMKTAPNIKVWSDYAGKSLASSITTATSLVDWYDGDPPVSGAYIVASKTLAQTYTDDKLIYRKLFKGLAQNCERGPSETFQRSSLSGKKQTWNNCRGLDITNFIVAAAPEGRRCVVVLQARLANEADREAIEHLIDTFEVDCRRSD